MRDLHARGLTVPQEPNHFHIHERYFLKVQDELRSVPLELCLQFLNMLRLKAANQADCCPSTPRILFDLHFRVPAGSSDPGWWQSAVTSTSMNG